MKVTFKLEGGFDDTIAWLKKASQPPSASVMDKIGREGVSALQKATPIGETGETARGWTYAISRSQNGAEVSFINRAHPESAVSVAKLIDMGYGTKNGGYVPPRPYIKQAITPILDKHVNTYIEEMMK